MLPAGVLAAALLAAPQAHALALAPDDTTAPSAASSVQVEQAWIPQPPPGTDVAAAYFTLHNAGTTADALIGIDSPLASGAMLHESLERNGEVQMRSRERLTLAPGQTVVLRPGGLHVMLHGVHGLQIGERVPLVLHLASGASLRVLAQVRPLGSP